MNLFRKRPRKAKEDDRQSDSFHAFVSDQPEKGLSLEQAKELQEKIFATLSETDDVNAKVNAAARLMTSGQFEACIQAYEHIATAHPQELPTCESQIGAAYYFLGQYEKAIEYYQRALEHGADPEMMADNTQEAREAIAKRK